MRARGPAYTAPTYSVGLRDRNLHRLSGFATSPRLGRLYRLGVEIRTQGSGARAARRHRSALPRPRLGGNRGARRAAPRGAVAASGRGIRRNAERGRPRPDRRAASSQWGRDRPAGGRAGPDAALPRLRAGPPAHPRRLRHDGAGRGGARWCIPTSSSCRWSVSTGAAPASATARATTTAPSPRSSARGLSPAACRHRLRSAGGRHHSARAA